MNVLCGNNFITISIIEDFFKYYKVPVESLHLANRSCRAHKEVISDVPYYMVQTSKDRYAACGGKPLEVSDLFPKGSSPEGWCCVFVTAAVYRSHLYFIGSC